MKSIKKLWTMVVVSMLIALTSSITALAAPGQEVLFYDEDGNQVYGSSMYYNRDNTPYFGRGCYYLDENGDNVSVYGCPVYMYDANGEFLPAPYCYGANGNIVYPNRTSGSFGRGGCCIRY